MTNSPELHIKLLIERYQQKIFSLVFYLVGSNVNQAYDITVSSFVDKLPSSPLFNKETFLAELAGVAIGKCRSAQTSSTGRSDILDLSVARKNLLKMTAMAFDELSFDDKVLLLLRDQLHFPYSDISIATGCAENTVKIQTVQARAKLRDVIKSKVERV